MAGGICSTRPPSPTATRRCSARCGGCSTAASGREGSGRGWGPRAGGGLRAGGGGGGVSGRGGGALPPPLLIRIFCSPRPPTRHTLAVIFGRDLAAPEHAAAHRRMIVEAVLAWLGRPPR